MAKIKFGAMMVDARGKLGGHVFAKNRGGAYIRTKTTPSNPQSINQSGVRSLFGAISQGWSGLTAEQRASWNNAVQSFQTTDVFGDIKTPSGKALYQRLNQNLLLGGSNILSIAPGLVEAPENVLNGAAIDTNVKNITLSGVSNSANVKLVIRASGPVTQGTNNVSNKLRVISTMAGNAIDAGNLYADYSAKFGAPVVGQKIFFTIQYLLENGIKTPQSKVIASLA